MDPTEERAACRAVAEAVLDLARVALPAPGAPRLLACPSCRWLPTPPVTLPCGHTLCRPCLAARCPLCQARLPHASLLRDNVLLKAALAKWLPAQVLGARLREQALVSLRQGDVLSSLSKFQYALETSPKDHVSLEGRSEALHKIGEYEASLRDAEAAVRLRPLWYKGYMRRAAALVSLGFNEEALISYLVFVALSKNPDPVRNQINLLIYRILSPGGKKLEPEAASLFPWWFQDSNKRTKPAIVNSPMEYKLLHSVIEAAFQEIEKLRRVEWEAGEVMLPVDGIEPADLECVLCCRLLWRPVTTPCGHTYCSMCLDRCLDYSYNCPLCMTSLADYLLTGERHVTELVEVAVLASLPQEYACRLLAHQREETALLHTSDLPVFVCTTAFPSVPCPLFVYEPKYRLMVRRAVASGHRRFAMSACLSRAPGPERYAEFGTVLEIKDWVVLSDGCSILSNVGGRRFRVVGRAERDGYDTAQVQYLIDEPVPLHQQPEVERLHNEVLERGLAWFSRLNRHTRQEIVRTFGEMPAPEVNWLSLGDGPSWTWWLLAVLPLGPTLQVGILGTTSIEKRLRAIDKTLRHLAAEEEPTKMTPVMQDVSQVISLV